MAFTSKDNAKFSIGQSSMFEADESFIEAPDAPAKRYLKTKLCNFNLRGKCTRGADCKYAHDIDELEPMPDLYKTRLCASLSKLGVCKNGDSCHYAHSHDELRSHCTPTSGTMKRQCSEGATPMGQSIAEEKTLRPAKAPLMKVDMCKFFQQGRCLRGEQCTFAHRESELQQRPNLLRTSPCFKFWTSGKCVDDCKYSHSLENLRSKGKSCLDDSMFNTSGIWSRQTTLEATDFDKDGAMSRQTTDCQLTPMSRQTTDVDLFCPLSPLSRQTTELDSMIGQMSRQTTELDSMLGPMSRQTTELDSMLGGMSRQTTEVESVVCPMSRQSSLGNWMVGRSQDFDDAPSNFKDLETMRTPNQMSLPSYECMRTPSSTSLPNYEGFSTSSQVSLPKFYVFSQDFDDGLIEKIQQIAEESNVDSSSDSQDIVSNCSDELEKADSCACGHVFEVYARFCMKCGAKRPNMKELNDLSKEKVSDGEELDDVLSSGKVSTKCTSTSFNQDLNDGVTQEMINYQCARLQEISKLDELDICVKNSFLAFEDRDSMCGTAARRSLSA